MLRELTLGDRTAEPCRQCVPRRSVGARAVVACATMMFVGTRALAADAPDFNRQIAPLFVKYCTSCHNAADREGKLVLESYAALLDGGKRGAEVVPGHPEQSRLVRVLSGDGELGDAAEG